MLSAGMVGHNLISLMTSFKEDTFTPVRKAKQTHSLIMKHKRWEEKTTTVI